MKILILLLVTTSVYASNSRAKFCSERKSFKAIQGSITDPRNLMGFDNEGGIGNAGVCWWHSRFQRNAHYLAVFEPLAKKQDNRFYKKIIRKMVRGKKILSIPGYPNLRSFTKAYQKYIQRQLNKWQLKDGIIKFAWVKGLQGKTRASSGQLKKMMDDLYNLVEKQQNLTYTKLQLKGITAHAWLVYKMKYRPTGYDIYFIDSNWANKPKKYSYYFGDETLDVYGGGLLYPEKGREFDKLKSVVKNYCAN